MNTRLLILSAVLALGGCAGGPRDRVVLLPGPDGAVGRIAVNPGAAETVLGAAWASASVDGKGRLAQTQSSAAQVEQEFGAALAALPPRPKSYTLYFELDSDRLTAESAVRAEAVLAEIAARPVADVIAIGHTDRVGELAYNDALSLQRAEKLRELLIAKGGDASRISVAGRGEREPLVPTADEVPEPRNRRAELSVR
ncbi:MAG TPA: OmpA family protein [Gammaproteobacteria bacterium]|nr:OmpA family protein [Gammaproteobacteria bacterium]